MRFVDTNVLLYAVGTASSEAAKRAVAVDLLQHEDLAVSVQVLQEFYVQATRASRADRMTSARAAHWVEAFARFPVQDTTLPLLRSALRTADRFRMTYWDAAIIEAARTLGCPTVLSEDLQHGQDFDGVRVVNPFRNGRK